MIVWRGKNGKRPDPNHKLSADPELAGSCIGRGRRHFESGVEKQKRARSLFALVDCFGQVSHAALIDGPSGDSAARESN